MWEVSVEAMAVGFHTIAQGLEELPQDGGATTGGHGGEAGLQGHCLLNELRTLFAASGQGCAENADNGDAEQGAGGVRPIVYVLLQGEGGLGATFTPDETDGVNMPEKCCRTTPLVSLRIEDGGVPEGQVEALHPCCVLVQQVAQIGGRYCRAGDGEKHATQ